MPITEFPEPIPDSPISHNTISIEHKWRWISAALFSSACRYLITEQISQLEAVAISTTCINTDKTVSKFVNIYFDFFSTTIQYTIFVVMTTDLFVTADLLLLLIYS